MNDNEQEPGKKNRVQGLKLNYTQHNFEYLKVWWDVVGVSTTSLITVFNFLYPTMTRNSRSNKLMMNDQRVNTSS